MKQLSDLSHTLLSWEKQANETMNIDAAMIYSAAWREVFNLMADKIRGLK